MITEQMVVEEDCLVLLDRLFHGETLTFFGEDGGGKHGSAPFPVSAQVLAYTIEIVKYSDDYSEIDALAYLRLDGYDAAVTGHAITDRNLRIALDQLLDREQIDRQALDWGPLDKQGKDVIVLKVNVDRLLDW